MKLHSVDESRLNLFLGWLRKDPVTNLSAIYDMVQERQKTTCYYVSNDEEIQGYLLTYRGLAYPVAVLNAISCQAVSLLLEKLLNDRMIIFSDPKFLDLIKQRFDVEYIVKEDLMVFDPRKTSKLNIGAARRLVPFESRKVFDLRSQEQKDTPAESSEEWIAKHTVYGIDDDSGEALVSVGGTWIESKEGWMLGGIFTSPKQRGKGFGRMIASALTKEAMNHTSIVTLFVVSSNKPAIKVYEGIGYSKASERLWIDTGLGLKPLGGGNP